MNSATLANQITTALRSGGAHSAKHIAATIGAEYPSVGKECSRLHKDGLIRAESIWVKERPTIKKPVLHYFI